jgi:seryl-tRNA synthetase
VVNQVLDLDLKRRALLTPSRGDESRAQRGLKRNQANERPGRASNQNRCHALAGRPDRRAGRAGAPGRSLICKRWWPASPTCRTNRTPYGTVEQPDNVVVRQSGEPKPEPDFRSPTALGTGSRPGDHRFRAWGKDHRLAILHSQRGWGALAARLDRLDARPAHPPGLSGALPALYGTRSQTLFASGQLPKFAENLYHDVEEDFWNVPTAEVPLTGMHMDEILEDAIPAALRYTAYTPCFRREKMSAGRDVRGIKRGHQFDKVEMYIFCKPEDSYRELEKMVADAEATCADWV